MTKAAQKPQCHDIVVDEFFPHAPELIWKTLTTGVLIRQWLMELTGFAPVVGTHFTFQTTPAGAWDGVIHNEVLVVRENAQLVYSWKGGHESNVGYGSRLDIIVSWILTPVAGGTRLQLIHSGFILPHNNSAYTLMSEGWKEVVEHIGALSGTLQ